MEDSQSNLYVASAYTTLIAHTKQPMKVVGEDWPGFFKFSDGTLAVYDARNGGVYFAGLRTGKPDDDPIYFRTMGVDDDKWGAHLKVLRESFRDLYYSLMDEYSTGCVETMTHGKLNSIFDLSNYMPPQVEEETVTADVDQIALADTLEHCFKLLEQNKVAAIHATFSKTKHVGSVSTTNSVTLSVIAAGEDIDLHTHDH